MSQARRCLVLKTGSENSTLKIYVKLSKKHNIWALSLSKIKRMKCDTSSPLFQLKKSFKSYWVIQGPNAFRVSDLAPFTQIRLQGYVSCEWRHSGMQNMMLCITPFRGQFVGVWTRVGSTYVWEWHPWVIDGVFSHVHLDNQTKFCINKLTRKKKNWQNLLSTCHVEMIAWM